MLAQLRADEDVLLAGLLIPLLRGSTARRRRAKEHLRRAGRSGSRSEVERVDGHRHPRGLESRPADETRAGRGPAQAAAVAGLRRAPRAAAARGAAGPHAQPQGRTASSSSGAQRSRLARSTRRSRTGSGSGSSSGKSRTWRSATASLTSTSASPAGSSRSARSARRYIEDVKRRIERELEQAGIDGDVTGRPKHIYSIYRKMQRKGLAFEQVMDVLAVRIQVETVADCYAALGIVHGLWTYMPGEFDDYIATPKENNYRSLHTAVIGPGRLPLEVQIRTREMHDHAELGVAAHWQYKEGRKAEASFQQKINWLRQLLEPVSTRRRRAGPARRAAGRDLRGPGLCAEPEGRGRGPAARRHAARFRLSRAHEPRSPLPRRQGQRPHGVARTMCSPTATRSRSSPASSRTPAATGWCPRSASSSRSATAPRSAPGSASSTKARTASMAARCTTGNSSASACGHCRCPRCSTN